MAASMSPRMTVSANRSLATACSMNRNTTESTLQDNYHRLAMFGLSTKRCSQPRLQSVVVAQLVDSTPTASAGLHSPCQQAVLQHNVSTPPT